MIVQHYAVSVRVVRLTPDLPGPALYCDCDGKTQEAPKNGDYLVEDVTGTYWYIVPKGVFEERFWPDPELLWFKNVH